MQTLALESIVISPKLPAKSSIIWLHGLGADGEDFVDVVSELRLPEEFATRFIFPHAPIVPVSLNGGMPMRAWFDIYGLTRDSAQDEAGIKRSHQAISQLIAHEQTLGIASEKIILGGFSQGGAMALYTGLHYPATLGGVFGLSTFLPSKDYWQNHPPINTQTPIFMAHGEFDPMLNIALGKASCERLIELGCTVEWHQYPMPHSVCPEEIHDLARWFKAVLNTHNQVADHA